MTLLSTSPFIAIHHIHLTLLLRYVYVTVFLNQSLLKKRIQKICTHVFSKFLYPNKYQFYFLTDFTWTTPKKILNRQFQALKKDDHPCHPNIGSTPPLGKYLSLGLTFHKFTCSLHTNSANCFNFKNFMINFISHRWSWNWTNDICQANGP